MNIERVERLVLRFSVSEVAALLKLMSIEALPGLSIRPEYPEDKTVEKLVQGGIVMPCGEKTFVDRMVSLAFRSAAGSSRYLAAKSPEGEAAVYAAGKLWVLIESAQSVVRMEPIRDFRSAAGPWANAVRKLGKELSFVLAAGGEPRTLAGDANAAKELLAQLNDGEV